jgi:RimJ/RimL family protein N-acetyltransferase
VAQFAAMNAAGVTIRAIEAEDIAAYHALFGRMARERFYFGFTAAPPLAETAAYAQDMIARRLPFYVAIATAEGVIGWCDIAVAKPRPERPGFDHVGTFGIGLDERHWRRGIGTRLGRAALAHAERIGLERVELAVFGWNAGAVALYQTLGFVHEGVRRRGRKLDGRHEDVIMMARLSGPAAP